MTEKSRLQEKASDFASELDGLENRLSEKVSKLASEHKELGDRLNKIVSSLANERNEAESRATTLDGQTKKPEKMILYPKIHMSL